MISIGNGHRQMKSWACEHKLHIALSRRLASARRLTKRPCAVLAGADATLRNSAPQASFVAQARTSLLRLQSGAPPKEPRSGIDQLIVIERIAHTLIEATVRFAAEAGLRGHVVNEAAGLLR